MWDFHYRDPPMLGAPNKAAVDTNGGFFILIVASYVYTAIIRQI